MGIDLVSDEVHEPKAKNHKQKNEQQIMNLHNDLLCK
jgi:hypothetical protein